LRIAREAGKKCHSLWHSWSSTASTCISDGTHRGFEDFSVLNGRRTDQKYGGTKGEQQGFSVNSMRELAILPDEASRVVTENRVLLKRLLAMNIEAEKPRMAP
jgi:hypothetical protein